MKTTISKTTLLTIKLDKKENKILCNLISMFDFDFFEKDMENNDYFIKTSIIEEVKELEEHEDFPENDLTMLQNIVKQIEEVSKTEDIDYIKINPQWHLV